MSGIGQPKKGSRRAYVFRNAPDSCRKRAMSNTCVLAPGEDIPLPACGGLANTDGAAIVAARAGAPFATVVDLWRRSNACMIWTTTKKKRMIGLLSGGRD